VAILAVLIDLFTDTTQVTTCIPFNKVMKVNEERTISLQTIGVRIMAIRATASYSLTKGIHKTEEKK
jgi:hypothetical protein